MFADLTGTLLPPYIEEKEPTITPSAVSRSFPSWMLIVAAAVLTVGVCAFTAEYVEGDEAASLLYHGLGRNEFLQPPFASYQRGMDLLLGLLPQDPELLLGAGKAIGLAAAGLSLAALLALAFDQAEIRSRRVRLLGAAAVLLAVPEFLYLGLLYTPLLAGLAAAAGAHLLLRRALLQGPPVRRPLLRISAALLLLACAGAVRWDMFLYPFIIAADFALHRRRLRVPVTMSWQSGLLIALPPLAAIGLVSLFAYPDPGELPRRALRWAEFAFSVPKAPDGRLELGGAYLSVLTPGALALALIGMAHLFSSARAVFLFTLLIAGAALLWPLWFSPKEMLLFAPVWVLLITGGVQWLAGRASGPALRRIPAVAAVLLLVAPWLIGVRGHHGDAAWGPGFDQRPLDRPPASGRSALPAFADGLAIPTREGHRPFWGHAYVLLGGGWRRFVTMRAGDRREAIRRALRENVPLIRIPASSLLEEAELVRQGFTTSMPFIRGAIPPPGYRTRVFTRGGEVLLLVEARPETMDRPAAIAAKATGGRPATGIVVTGWADPLRSLFRSNAGRITPLGRNAGWMRLAGERS